MRTSPLFSSFLSEKVVENSLSFAEEADLDLLVILGDVKHSVRKYTPNEKKLVLELFRGLEDLELRTTVLKGNHDYALKNTIEKFELATLHEGAYMSLDDDTMVVHGHRLLPEESLGDNVLLVSGHLHPCVKVYRGMKRQSVVRVYLEFQESPLEEVEGSRRVVVLPAMSPLGCYRFDQSEVVEILPFMRDVDFEPRDGRVFDLERTYLGTVGEIV